MFSRQRRGTTSQNNAVEISVTVDDQCAKMLSRVFFSEITFLFGSVLLMFSPESRFEIFAILTRSGSKYFI